MWKSTNLCYKFNTYYLAEEGTLQICQGAQALTAEQRKIIDEQVNVFVDIGGLMPYLETLRAHGSFKFLVMPTHTVHGVMMHTDTLTTTGHIVRKSESGKRKLSFSA